MSLWRSAGLNYPLPINCFRPIGTGATSRGASRVLEETENPSLSVSDPERDRSRSAQCGEDARWHAWRLCSVHPGHPGWPTSGVRDRQDARPVGDSAVESDRVHPRESLIGLLWPDYAESSARQSLSQALSRLRTALGDRDAGDHARTAPLSCLNPLATTVQFNPRERPIRWDVAAFDENIAALRGLLADRGHCAAPGGGGPVSWPLFCRAFRSVTAPRLRNGPRSNAREYPTPPRARSASPPGRALRARGRLCAGATVGATPGGIGAVG